MAEVTNELIYDVLKALRSEVSEVRGDIRDIKSEVTAIRGHVTAIALDISNIYVRLGDHDDRLKRIETRLGLLEPAH